ncbi:MAG: hypothetical protein JWP97_3679 [Labilithrix sp.]|nr:hypothetical protein [Labilithrix sp.]
MARRTHPTSAGGPALHGAPQLGAAESAPTAPHATPASPPAAGDKPGRATGPARFWRGRGVRVALALALAASALVHGWVAPFSFLPEGGLEMKDVDGELTIPVELLGEEPPPEEKPEPPPEKTTTPENDPNGLKSRPDAGPRPKPDAGIEDAGPTLADAAIDKLTKDGGPASLASDGGAPSEGPSDGGPEGGLLAQGDASAAAGATGPRDPGAIIGLPGLISAGTVNVTLVVNIAVIRTNPVGARMGPLLYGIPQWNDFMKGSQATIDPIKDTDWILVYGPSLIHTERDAVIVHYAIADDVVDNAVESIAKRYERGGAYDVGVPGVKASLGHADNAERVFLRGQPHVLTIVPKDKATDFAKLMKRSSIQPKVRPGEAMRLIVKDPWKQISIPGLKFNESLKELRLWIIPRADGGADVNVEGDCTDEQSAADAADALTDLIRRNNSLMIRAATRGLLNAAKVEASGTHITSKVTASQEQLEALLQGVGAFLGVTVQPGPGGGGAGRR